MQKIHGLGAKPYAIVADGRVVNVIVWNPEEFPDWKPEGGEVVECDASTAIGNLYDGKEFSDPFLVVNDPPPLSEVKERRVADLDKRFVMESSSIFIAPEAHEEMRTKALAAIDAVMAAETQEQAQAARDQGFVDMIAIRVRERNARQ